MNKIPKRLSCADCSTKKERLIHWAVSAEVDKPGDTEPEGPWSWQILNHDKTARFTWPCEFDTKADAWAHIHSILKKAEEGVEVA